MTRVSHSRQAHAVSRALEVQLGIFLETTSLGLNDFPCFHYFISQARESVTKSIVYLSSLILGYIECRSLKLHVLNEISMRPVQELFVRALCSGLGRALHT
jgi:hypothetical protein